MTTRTGGHDNGITAARLGLALVVVVSHSFGLTGHLEPLVRETGLVSAGFLAVLGFFGLSGWLLVGSRRRNDRLSFAANRVRRIYPAYWLALGVGAGIAMAIGGGTAEDAGRYIVGNLPILGTKAGFPSAFDGQILNGSLWTLGVELSCYVALAIAPVRWLRPLSIGLGVMFVALWPVAGGAETALFIAFAAGAAVRAWDREVSPRLAVVLAVAAVVAIALQLTPLFAALTAAASLGLAHMPLRWSTDLSYGTYVFASPVGVALASFGLDTLPVMAGTIAIVMPMAWLSWKFLEVPAMRFRLMAGRRATVTSSVGERGGRNIGVLTFREASSAGMIRTLDQEIEGSNPSSPGNGPDGTGRWRAWT